jgi:hypothetical protein
MAEKHNSIVTKTGLLMGAKALEMRRCKKLYIYSAVIFALAIFINIAIKQAE